jgi:hypothetical protein
MVYYVLRFKVIAATDYVIFEAYWGYPTFCFLVGWRNVSSQPI